jgi:predicted dehydrogenase
MELWWPDPGHPIGWGDTFMHEVAHFLDAVAGEHGVTPLAADFEDGYRCAAICDAILRAAVTGEREPIAYRSLSAQPAR